MPRPEPWWKGERGEWYVAVQAVLFVLIAIGPWLQYRLLGVPVSWGAAAIVAGIALVLAGGALAVGGLIALGRRNLTALPYPTEMARLRDSGPYAIVRHPIYSGLVLAAIGYGLARHSWLTLVFACALFVLFDLKSRREEAWLTERFPEYPTYQARVKKLIPWMY